MCWARSFLNVWNDFKFFEEVEKSEKYYCSDSDGKMEEYVLYDQDRKRDAKGLNGMVDFLCMEED